MTTSIQRLDQRIEALKAKRVALVREQEKRAEQHVIAAARRAGLLALPAERIDALFATLAQPHEEENREAGTTGNPPAGV